MVLKYAYLAIATNDDDDISDEFVSRLACDSIKSESDLRQLFRHSQGWDENLQAIVINGTKTHNPDYILVQNLANSILLLAKFFNVDTYGLCISCGKEISNKLYCKDCNHADCEFCQECETYCSETWEVINRHGERIHVCETCLDEHYRLCEHCNEYYPRDTLTITGDGSRVCSQCISEDYAVCGECNEYFLRNQLSQSIDSNGDEIFVCHDCRDKFYKDNNVSQSSQREEVSA
ncbi:MAG: hypothetical protein IJQ82_13660 [Selenomonadaceae bacterium]|nr:hypothetical protein [Selenomonadaceae bacterium]